MPLLSDADVGLGTTAPAAKPQLLSDDQVGLGESNWTGKSLVKQGLTDTLGRLKRAGGEAAALADMVLGMPSFIVSTGAQLGATAKAVVQGQEKPFEIGREAGRQVSEMPVVRAGVNPLQKIIKLFDSGEIYDQTATVKGMEKFGHLLEEAGKNVEEASGGRISRDSVPMFVETLMTGMVGLTPKAKKGIQPWQQKALREHATRMKEQSELDIAGQRIATEDLIKSRVHDAAAIPVYQQINDLLGIRTPAEQAKLTRERRADLKRAYTGAGKDRRLSAEEQGQLDVAEASGARFFERPEEADFFAGERLANEAELAARDADPANRIGGTPYEVGSKPTPERVGQGEILRILQKPGFERTAEDLLTLRRASKEEGFAKPEALALLSAAGIGALVGAPLDDNHLRGATLGFLTGAAAAVPFMFRGESVGKGLSRQRGAVGLDTRSVVDSLMASFGGTERAKWTPQQKKNAADMAVIEAKRAKTDLMRQKYEQAAKILRGEMEEPGLVGNVYGGLGKREIGAVKAPGGMWHPEAVERLSSSLGPKIATRSRQQVEAVLADQPVKYSKEVLDEVAADKKVFDWSDKAIRNYLNRYAGTERDPLKDVEIPGWYEYDNAGGLINRETVRWEEAFDGVVSKNNIPYWEGYYKNPITYTVPEWAKQIPPEEEVYGIGGKKYGHEKAIIDYLSHVGDYLRQNVDPAKLPQYDLVRAVRETHQNDLRVAKEMEKAAAASTKDLPVYKDYGDGFKWVELKLPEKLTPEQAKQVRPATVEELKQFAREDEMAGGAGEYIEGEKGYIALGADGKPIRNSYTNQIALEGTPARAYLAGRLAEEGNQMGHCVGGYCEGVASGESRIFSLRDAKGQSHVTIEVAPREPRTVGNAEYSGGGELGGNTLMRRFGARGKEAWNAYLKEKPESIHDFIRDKFPDIWEQVTQSDISQIKGKQNRAPDAKYLPYVQDFVKGGKWGEVGDLENTGLKELDLAYWGKKEPDFSAKLQERFQGQRFITPEEAKEMASMWDKHTGGTDTIARAETRMAQDELRELQGLPPLDRRGQGPRNERGFIDQKLIMGTAALGLGGLIGSQWAEDPLNGAVLGSIAASGLFMPGFKNAAKTAVKGAEYGLGMISTRIKNASPELHQRLITYEQQVLEQGHKELNKTVPWMKESVNLPADKRASLDAAIFMKDSEAIAAINKGNPKLVDGWREVRNTLGDLGKRAQVLGRFKEMLDDYFPQRVKDYEGLKDALQQPVRARIEQKLEEARKKRGGELSEVERDAIVNRELRGNFQTISRQPGYSKARMIKQVTEKLRPFYHTPQEALAITISEITRDLEMAKLFGRDLVQKSAKGRSYIDTEASIGNIVGRELAEGRIDTAQVRELESILKSRFGPGERSPVKAMQNMQNLGYAGLLGDLPSAAVQIGDPLLSFYLHETKPTLVAAARKFTGKAKITAKELGLVDHIAEDLAFGSTQTGSSGKRVKIATGAGAAAGAVAGALLADDVSGALPGAAAGAFIGYASLVGTAAALNKVLRQGVFAPIDKFGKDIQLGAAHEKLTRWAQSPGGMKNLENAYGEAFGPDFPRLVGDLKTGKLTPTVRSALFAELSRSQPISKLEAPQALLDHPNARLMYMLKRFMLKQADLVRRESYNEFKQGAKLGGEEGMVHVRRGLKNAGEFALVLGLSGATASMVQDWLLGREVDFTAGDVAENVLKTFGMSRYVMDKVKQGDWGPIQALASVAMPPWMMFERILKADPKAVQYIPVIGQMYYNWELGGREEAEIRRAKDAKKEGRDVSLSSRAEDYLERKREARRERREREGR
jgi:hypothetical protein